MFLQKTKADSSLWDFGLPVFLLLDCNYLCILVYTVVYMYVCHNSWIVVEVSGDMELLVSVSITWK